MRDGDAEKVEVLDFFFFAFVEGSDAIVAVSAQAKDKADAVAMLLSEGMAKQEELDSCTVEWQKNYYISEAVNKLREADDVGSQGKA